ncbi:hypothetical protein [Pseudomonas gingeri]|uniref:LPD3 domain-containing protein n=1 Tax=Pseudomonas gingeri TaxID=117681 RepID=UPI0015A19557|nr:hypothetical protein [Pseudomonas gingeri]NWA11938.1 hypothetical protein [Pseudomonas gingeri]
MTDMSQGGPVSPIERARLSAELLQVRASLAGTALSPIERVRASARGLAIRAQLGQQVKPDTEAGQAAFEAARQFYQENLKGQLINSVVGPVRVNSAGWKKSKQGMKSDLLKARLIEHVRDILESGTAGQRQAPHKVRNDGLVAFYFIQKQVRVDDLLVTAGVTVAEDDKGNLFYSVSHAGRDTWKAKENGEPDYVGVGPHSGIAADGMLDALQQVQGPGAVGNTVADDDINITILAVVAVAAERQSVTSIAVGKIALATGMIAQKSGGVLVTGDPASLSAYVATYLENAKHTQTATGITFGKAQKRLAEFIPDSAETLASGAVLFSHKALGGGYSIAWEKQQSGVAISLAALKSVMATEWGPDKFRAVFGEEAAPADVQAYLDEQQAIAQRKQGQIDDAARAQAEEALALEQRQAESKAAVEETARVAAQLEADNQAEFERTVGAGKVDNPIYQAYLDTLEELPTTPSNAGFLGWAGIRAGEYERMGKGRPSANKDAYVAYVRAWADDHLSQRVRDADRVEKADTYAARAVGCENYAEYAASRIDKLPLQAFQVARAKYKIIEYLGENGRSDRLTLGALALQGANSEGPSALAQLRQDGYVLNNLRAQSNPFSLAPGVTLESFVSGSAKPVPLAAQAVEQVPPATPGVEPPQIIEYKTKRDKVLRGIIRTDLTLAEAKAIDPYTWRMNGGYFIREKHLGGDTSAVQAAPAPVVLSPEQEAEKQERDTRAALERQQQAISNQVVKLRDAGAKAIESGNAGMNTQRQTNTHRRAGMAASAYARSANDESEGQTLNNIADAIEIGAGGALTTLTSRAQLQELKKALNQAKYESEKNLSYSERLERTGQPFQEDQLQFVRMPVAMVWSTRYKNAALNIAKKAPTGNSRLIAALTKMGARTERWVLRDDGDIAITRKAFQVLKTIKESYDLQDVMDALGRVERLKRMGVANDAQLQDACRALLPHMSARKEESAITKAERAIIGQKVGIDFFPTPAAVAQRMARLARITKGTRVLEPSAGNGNLADAAAAAGGEVDVLEISSQLRDILTVKGYSVVGHDFNDFTPEAPYQAILMNPPFSKRQDAEHIMQAYGMLASGGTLVAIAGEGVFFGQDAKAENFRAWLDTHGADVEKLEGGTFNDNALLAQTSANARMIVLHK